MFEFASSVTSDIEEMALRYIYVFLFHVALIIILFTNADILIYANFFILSFLPNHPNLNEILIKQRNWMVIRVCLSIIDKNT